MASALSRAFADDRCSIGAPDPTKRHRMLPAWFTLGFRKPLELLGTDPSHQRKEVGAALMKPVLGTAAFASIVGRSAGGGSVAWRLSES